MAPHPPILDTHIHLWPSTALRPTDHTWMPPSGHTLARRHGITDYHASTASSPYRPSGVIYVETDRHLPTPSPASSSPTDDELREWARAPLEELAFLRRVVEGRSEDAESDGFAAGDGDLVRGLVVWAPFHLAGDVFDRYLGIAEQTLGEAAWERVVGFRYLLQGRGAQGVKDVVENGDFVSNVVKLARMGGGRGKVFDVGADAHRDGVEAVEWVGELVGRVRACAGGEGVRFVLNHLCKPNLSTPSTHYPSYARYTSAMQRYASDPHVYMKISGALNEFEPTPTPADPVEILATLTPYLDHTYAVFGAKRLMFGSDWPVCNVGGPKGEREGEESNWSLWRSVVDRWMREKGLTEEERASVWAATGVRAYGIEGFVMEMGGEGEMGV